MTGPVVDALLNLCNQLEETVKDNYWTISNENAANLLNSIKDLRSNIRDACGTDSQKKHPL